MSGSGRSECGLAAADSVELLCFTEALLMSNIPGIKTVLI
jgi:hypothetical protein